jgi:hypothetical protein
MVTIIVRVINPLVWIGWTLIIWQSVNPSIIVLMIGVALNVVLCLITDFIIRVLRG